MKKKNFQKLIIILIVMIITISAPLGSAHIGQQQAYAFNQMEFKAKVASFLLAAVTSLQTGLAKDALGQVIDDNWQSIEEMANNSHDMITAYPKLVMALSMDRIDLLDDTQKDIHIAKYDNITELKVLTAEQKTAAWNEAKAKLADGILTPREMYEGTGLKFAVDSILNLAIDALKLKVGEVPELGIYQTWNNYPEVMYVDPPYDFNLETYPYQLIMIDNNGNICLLADEVSFKKYPPLYSGWPERIMPSDESNLKFKKFVDGVWIGSNSTSSLNLGEIYESNHDIVYNPTNELIFGQNVGLPFLEDDFNSDMSSLADGVLVPDIPVNPDYDGLNEDEPPLLIPETIDVNDLPDTSISVDYNPDTGAEIVGIHDVLGQLENPYLESDEPITAEPELTNTLLKRIRDLVDGIKEKIDVGNGTIADNPDIVGDIPLEGTQDFPIEGVDPNDPGSFGFLKFLNLILLILINILKYVVAFIVFVISLSSIPSANNLITDPTLIATLNWWKTNKIPVFNLSLMQIITGYLFLMMAIRIFSIIRGWIERRAPNFSISEMYSSKTDTSLSDLSLADLQKMDSFDYTPQQQKLYRKLSKQDNYNRAKNIGIIEPGKYSYTMSDGKKYKNINAKTLDMLQRKEHEKYKKRINKGGR